MERLERQMDVARQAASKARQTTIKAVLIGEGRAKRAERDEKLGGKRARKEKKKAEEVRLATVALATRYSQLTGLQDQLKLHNSRRRSRQRASR